MSWPRVALMTLPYPDINLVGLGVECSYANFRAFLFGAILVHAPTCCPYLPPTQGLGPL